MPSNAPSIAVIEEASVLDPNLIVLIRGFSVKAPPPIDLIVDGKIGIQPSMIEFFLNTLAPMVLSDGPKSTVENLVLLPKLSAKSILPEPSVSAICVVRPYSGVAFPKTASLSSVVAPPLPPVIVTEVSGLFWNPYWPTDLTDAGIVNVVSPRFINPPTPISSKPVAGKTMEVRPRLTFDAPLAGANALIETDLIPCGIVAVPVQPTPALEGMLSPATQKLPLVQIT